MSKVYTIGLAEINVGDMGNDGGMGSQLKSLGQTYQDTATMTMEDPETTDHYAEEVDDPVVSISRGGKTLFNFSIMNPSVSVLAELLGGTADEEENTWEAPAKLPVVEKSVTIKPIQGLTFDIPRLRMTSKINANFSKSGILLIEVAGTVMQPLKESTAKMKAYIPQAGG